MRTREGAAEKRYAGGPVKKDSKPAEASKETPKVPDASPGQQSAEANSEGAAAAGAPSVANVEDVLARHSREHAEYTKSHEGMIKSLMLRHAEERAGIIGGTGDEPPKAA